MRKLRSNFGQTTGYGIALLAVGIAFAVTYSTWPFLEQTPWALFFAGVMAAAWFGGHGPGLCATALAAIIGNYYFIAPYGVLSTSLAGLSATGTFVLVSLFISFLASARRTAEAFERAERRRFQATMTSIGDAVIATDGKGCVTFMNGVAEELTGWPCPEAEGKPLE
jgi:PAS domain-containing protein